MSIRTPLLVAAVSLISVFGTARFISAHGQAQPPDMGQQLPRLLGGTQLPMSTPNPNAKSAEGHCLDCVISGSDIGFLVDHVDARGVPTGYLVVRVNGQWVSPAPMAVVTPAYTPVGR